MSPKRSIRVLLVGDDGVGKTSLITTFFSGTFEDSVVPVLPPAHYTPTQWDLTDLSVVIVDSTPDGPLNDAELERADVVCIVYDVTAPKTLARAKDFYIPWVRKHDGANQLKPIVLAGNKVDFGTEMEAIQEQVRPIMERNQGIEYCVQCSAKMVRNCNEALYYAAKAVILPTAPLYDVTTHNLRPLCVRALTRIFTDCDRDGDDFLNDSEINIFQTRCFDVPLQPTELEGLKQFIRVNFADGVVDGSGITLLGFLFLFRSFIERSRTETVWTALRAFGYSEHLRLDRALLPKMAKCGETLELSSTGLAWLTQLFASADGSKTGVVQAASATEIFDTTPGIPWMEVGADFDYPLQCRDFLTYWRACLVLDPYTVLEYLTYFGMPFKQLEKAVTRKPTRTVDCQQGGVSRRVLRGFVFGSAGCGKSTVCQSLPCRIEGDLASCNGANAVMTTTGTVNVKVGASARATATEEVTLVLQEIATSDGHMLAASAGRLVDCDVVVLTYDVNESSSFQYIRDVHAALADATLPCVVIGTKPDVDIAQSALFGSVDGATGVDGAGATSASVNASGGIGGTGDIDRLVDRTETWESMGVQPPILFSSRDPIPSEVPNVIALHALQPQLSSPAYAKMKRQPSSWGTALMVLGIGAAAAAGAMFLVKRSRR